MWPPTLSNAMGLRRTFSTHLSQQRTSSSMNWEPHVSCWWRTWLIWTWTQPRCPEGVPAPYPMGISDGQEDREDSGAHSAARLKKERRQSSTCLTLTMSNQPENGRLCTRQGGKPQGCGKVSVPSPRAEGVQDPTPLLPLPCVLSDPVIVCD